jgi:hypothetical protein
MSKYNKVNPGMYTQRGRLTQDDAARELRKQRAIGSEQTWQPVNTKAPPRPADHGDADRDPEGPADNESTVEPSLRVDTRSPRGVASTKAASSNTRAKAAKAKTPATRKPPKATGRAKTGTAKTGKPSRATKATATSRTKATPTRKAVLARNAGGPGASPRQAPKRRRR